VSEPFPPSATPQPWISVLVRFLRAVFPGDRGVLSESYQYFGVFFPSSLIPHEFKPNVPRVLLIVRPTGATVAFAHGLSRFVLQYSSPMTTCSARTMSLCPFSPKPSFGRTTPLLCGNSFLRKVPPGSRMLGMRKGLFSQVLFPRVSGRGPPVTADRPF